MSREKPKVPRAQILAHIKAIPGLTTRQLADFYGLEYEHFSERLRSLKRQGFLRVEMIDRAEMSPGPAVLHAWYFDHSAPVSDPIRGTRWTAEEKQAIRKCYVNTPMDELILMLPGRTVQAIRKQAQDMRVHRDPEFVNATLTKSFKDLGERRKEAQGKFEVQIDLPIRRAYTTATSGDQCARQALSQMIPLEAAWRGMNV